MMHAAYLVIGLLAAALYLIGVTLVVVGLMRLEDEEVQ